MGAKTKVYFYRRVSTAMQVEGYSLEAQLDKLNKYCDLHDYECVRDYVDAGASGKNTEDRSEFNKMIEDIENERDDISFVLCFKLSRFGRNVTDILTNLQIMKRHNVHLICTEDSLNSSKAQGKLLITVLGCVAEIERENIIAQSLAGRRQKALSGKWNGGPAPYGYTLTPSTSTLTLNPEEAEIVRLIYTKFTHEDIGAGGIANYLNNRNITKKTTSRPETTRQHSSTFSADFIKNILDNEVYMGKIAYGKRANVPIEGEDNKYHRIKQADSSKIILVNGLHEPIVSEELWNEAHLKRVETGIRQEKKDKDHYYVLGGLLKCPACGHTMYGVPNGTKKKADGTYYPRTYSYTCRNRKYSISSTLCPSPRQISAKLLESEIDNILIALMQTPKIRERMEDLVAKKADANSILDEINDIERHLKEIRAKEQIWVKKIAEIDTSTPQGERKEELFNKQLDEFFNEEAEVQKALEETRKRLIKAREGEINREYIGKFLLKYGQLSQIITSYEKKHLLSLFIESIDLYPEKTNGHWMKTVHFKFPIVYTDPDPNAPHNSKNEGDKGVKDLEVNSLPLQTPVETVVLLGREKGKYISQATKTLSQAKSHISFDLNTEDIFTTPSQSTEEIENKGGYATYQEIKAYIFTHHQIKVHTAEIAQTKQKYHLIERKCYNKPQNPKTTPRPLTPEKEALILEALRHFGMIV